MTSFQNRNESGDLGRTYLQAVSSLIQSSSSLAARLGFREAAREPAGLLTFELAPLAMRERALRETVLWLSRAWRRRSCILTSRPRRTWCGIEYGKL